MFFSIYFFLISCLFFFSTFTGANFGGSFDSGTNNNLAQTLTIPRQSGQAWAMPLTAKSALIIDAKTKTKLWAKDESVIRPIASITKLMTALVFLKDSPAWDKLVTIESADFAKDNSRNLKLGDQLTVKDLFYASLIGSDNVGMTALVRTTGLSEEQFVAKMNAKARQLGMSNTVFDDPTGLSIKNISTADDLSKLAFRAFNEPVIKEATSLNYYQFRLAPDSFIREVKNTNRLLDQTKIKVLSGKTGYLIEAGYCLVSELADENDHKIIIILLGSDQEEGRFAETKALAEWVFGNYTFYIN